MAILKRRESHIFERLDEEWYVEPIAVSDALFCVEKFEGGIWDPACGQGNVLEAAVAHGYRVVGSDIVQRGAVSTKLWNVGDFFVEPSLLLPNIVTNPPFGRALLAEKFIRHALALRPQKLAVFVDSRFLFGSARAAGLFADMPPARVWIITPRPSCPPGEYLVAGNKACGGTADYVWLVWDTPREDSWPTVQWLRSAT